MSENFEIIKLRRVLEKRVDVRKLAYKKSVKDLDDLQAKCKHTEGWEGNDDGPGASRTCPVCGYCWCK